MPDRCSKCLKEIIPPNPISRHNGKSYHYDCFLCTLCNKPIIGVTNFPELLRCSKCIEEHGPKCYKCKSGFSPKLNMLNYVKIQNQEKYFHTECSSCEKCNQTLTEKVYEQAGKFICLNCKNKEIQNNLEKCTKCDELILNSASVKYNNKTYHETCLLCVYCNEILIGKFFKYNDQEPLCEKCNYKEIAKNAHTCSKCDNLIIDYGVNLSDKYYHQSCLTCFSCNLILLDNQVILYSNEPYCKNCYTKEFTKTCIKCGTSIDPITKFISFDNKNYHEACFICNLCKNSIDKTFYQNDSELICTNCKEVEQ
jgi:hypothetical protein